MKKRFVLSAVPIFLILCSILASALTISFSIPSQYQEVRPGNPLYMQTEIKWPENTIKQDLTVEYSVKGQKSNEDIAYLKVLRAIDTQASFLDSILIPSGTKPGVYITYENISNSGNLSEQTAASFNVVQGDPDIFRTYLFVIGGVVGLISILVITELFILLKRK